MRPGTCRVWRKLLPTFLLLPVRSFWLMTAAPTIAIKRRWPLGFQSSKPHAIWALAGRNYGVERLSGEWVHFLDADDVLSAAVLRKSQSYLCTSVDVLLIGASWVDERSDALLSEWSFSLEDIAEDPLLYTLTSPIPTCCSIVRIDKFRAVGGFDSSCRCWEDGDLHLRLVAHGARIAVMDDVLTTAIRHDRGASSNHLYCHRCRLAFLKRYAQQQLPIEPAAMANEFLAIGNLLLGERRYGEALEAFQLAHRAHPIQPKSNRALVRRLMAFLPPPWPSCCSSGCGRRWGNTSKFRSDFTLSKLAICSSQANGFQDSPAALPAGLL